MVSSPADHACEFVRISLAAVASPEKAPQMQAYMKTDTPFYGVQKAGRVPILRQLVTDFPPGTAKEYERMVLALWDLPHREEKYIALGYACRFPDHITPERIPLYRRLIVSGAWWDFVDEVATKLIRHLVIEYPSETWSVVDTWIDESDMWLRRTALICQVGAKDATDSVRLFDFALHTAHEKEFFIRKAIGWALREYSKTKPEAVAGFINANASQLSGLSFREGSKHIKELVEPRD